MGTVQTNIRLDKELRSWYEAKAVEHDRDASYFMKKALVNFRQQCESSSIDNQATVKQVVVPKKEVKAKEKFNPDDVDYIGLNRSAWLEWCAYRKSKRKPISKAAAKKQTETLLMFDEVTQKQMIDHSIANDYQGIFEPKNSFIGGQNKNINDTRNLTIEHQLSDRSWAD